MSTEIASAYLALYARMPGVQGDIAKQLGDVDTDKVGRELGKKTGAGYTKGFALAGAVGGLVATLAASAAQSVGDLVGDAVAASDATQKFAQSLQFADVDTSTIDRLQKSTKAYADSTVYDLATVQNTTAQLAANGVKDYDKLTEAAGNLNAVAGGNQATFSSVAMMLTQTAGAGKLTTENWNQLADAIPGASGQLQDALLQAGAYTGNFREAMEKGEITADEFNAALLNLGTQPVAVEAAKSTETLEGAVGNLNATIVSGLTGAINFVKPALTGLLTIFSAFIANSKIFIPVVAGLGAALLTALAPAIWAAVVATWNFTVALLANPITWIVIGIGLLVAAIVALAVNWDTVVAWLTTVWNGFVTWFTAVMDGFLGWWNGLWTAVWEWIVSVWTNIVTAVAGFFTTLWGGLVTVGGAIAGWWNGLWSGIGSFIGQVWGNIVGFVTAYINMVFAIIVAVGSAISGWWNGLWTGIVAFFTGIWDAIIGTIQNVQSVFGSVFNAIAGIVRGAFEGVVSVIRNVINGIIGAVNGVINGINGVAGVVGGAIGVNLKVGTIPKLKDGAVVTRRPGGIVANIGEGRYDEAVLPLSPTVLQQLGGGGAGAAIPNIEIHIGEWEFLTILRDGLNKSSGAVLDATLREKRIRE